MPRPFELRLSELAAGQCGVVARAQVLASGGSNSLDKRRLASGAWEVRHPGVYAISAVPTSWHQDLWAALLAIGPRATVSHETALRLHGLGDDLVPSRPLTFTIPHGGHVRVAGAVVHQIDDLAPVDVGAVAMLPSSRPHRAVVEVAATVGRRRLGDVVDELLVTRRTSHEAIAACLARVIRPGKPGVVALGQVLDERGDGYVADASELERALFSALRSAELPLPRRQVPLPGRGALEGLVDAAYHDAKVIIEADGRRWHTRIRDLKRDHQRDAEAARVGWQTLRFLYEEIMGDPGDVCAVIRDVCAVRMRSQESPASCRTPARSATAGVGEAIASASALLRQ
jgi:very-short-patch-repair endonuclease